MSVVEHALLDAFNTGPHGIALFDDGDRLVHSNAMFRAAWAVDRIE